MTVPAPPLTQYATLTQAGVNTLDADLLQVGSDAMIYGGVAGGTANAITLTIPLALQDYFLGMGLVFVASANNTAGATITVTTPAGTLAPITLADQSGSALTANTIIAGNVINLKLCQAAGAGPISFRIAASAVPVSSVFGRTGAVSAATGDYSIGQITGAGTMASQNSGAVTITGGAISGVTGPSVFRAWITFNGTNGATIAAYNVTSVTRTGTGLYTVNIPAGVFADTSYAAVMCVSSATGGSPNSVIGFGQPTSATAFAAATVVSIDNTATDSTPITIGFMHA